MHHKLLRRENKLAVDEVIDVSYITVDGLGARKIKVVKLTPKYFYVRGKFVSKTKTGASKLHHLLEHHSPKRSSKRSPKRSPRRSPSRSLERWAIGDL